MKYARGSFAKRFSGKPRAFIFVPAFRPFRRSAAGETFLKISRR